MAKRCGDLAEFRFKVKAPSVGKTAFTKVFRKKDNNLTASHNETLTKAEDKKIRWPDLQKPKATEFFGGRKPDLKGLDKLSYKDKYTQQEFMLELFVDALKVKSTAGHLKINGYPDVGDDHKTIGIPMPTEMWSDHQFQNPVTGAIFTVRTLDWSDPTAAYWQPTPGSNKNCGNFHLSVKDGVVQVTVKVQPLCGVLRRGKVMKAIKKAAELFWNGAGGFRQWVYHRNDCIRKKDCDCAVLTNAKHQYIRAGCCKVPVQVIVEQGADNPVQVTFLTRAQKKQLKKQGHVTGLRANTLHFYYPENNPHTFAHEVGHMMGFPDQYWYGVIASGSLNATGQPAAAPGAFPIDDSSIMGQNMTQAKLVHIEAAWFSSWVNAKVDAMKPLKV